MGCTVLRTCVWVLVTSSALGKVLKECAGLKWELHGIWVRAAFRLCRVYVHTT